MSRTTRLKKLVRHKVVNHFGYIPTRFRRSGGRELRQRVAEESHDEYMPRTRHTCLQYPYYIKTWDDIVPSVGLWEFPWAIKFKIKPTYTNKKRRVKKKKK
jgi:hypothetical protein